MQVKKIFLVDDDPEDCGFFTSVAAQISPQLQVHVATSKEQLFQYLKQDVPDLLFMDSFIQNESSLASIREIRNRPHYHHLPIIMYTGSTDIKNIANAFEAGATTYIVKPHTLAGIKTVLQNMLNNNWTKASSNIAKQYYLDGRFHAFK
jgi:CheY-like chemotaxis protein